MGEPKFIERSIDAQWKVRFRPEDRLFVTWGCLQCIFTIGLTWASWNVAGRLAQGLTYVIYGFVPVVMLLGSLGFLFQKMRNKYRDKTRWQYDPIGWTEGTEEKTGSSAYDWTANSILLALAAWPLWSYVIWIVGHRTEITAAEYRVAGLLTCGAFLVGLLAIEMGRSGKVEALLAVRSAVAFDELDLQAARSRVRIVRNTMQALDIARIEAKAVLSRIDEIGSLLAPVPGWLQIYEDQTTGKERRARVARTMHGNLEQARRGLQKTATEFRSYGERVRNLLLTGEGRHAAIDTAERIRAELEAAMTRYRELVVEYREATAKVQRRASGESCP